MVDAYHCEEEEVGRAAKFFLLPAYLQREREGKLSILSVPKFRFLAQDSLSFSVVSDNGFLKKKMSFAK